MIGTPSCPHPTQWLRKKGLAGADKKAGRVAAEGAIATYIHPGRLCGALSGRPGHCRTACQCSWQYVRQCSAATMCCSKGSKTRADESMRWGGVTMVASCAASKFKVGQVGI